MITREFIDENERIIDTILDTTLTLLDDVAKLITNLNDEHMTEKLKAFATEIIQEEYEINHYIEEIIDAWVLTLKESDDGVIGFDIENHVSGAIETEWHSSKTSNSWSYALQDYLKVIDEGRSSYSIPQSPKGEVLSIGSQGGAGGFPYNHQKGSKPITMPAKDGTNVKNRIKHRIQEYIDSLFEGIPEMVGEVFSNDSLIKSRMAQFYQG